MTLHSDNPKTYKIRSAVSVAAITAGLLLMAYMIVAEDEPGAIPLLFITFGTLSYVYNRSKSKIRRA